MVKLKEIQEEMKKVCLNGAFFSETTHDLTGPWNTLFEPLFHFFKFMKIKLGKIKDFKHETMRSFFFAKEIHEKDSENTYYDGIMVNVVKSPADTAWTLRHAFLKIWGIIDD